MASVNKVILIGNLGADPEIKQMQNGSVVANFSVATTETWKDKSTGEKKERAEWHRVTLFGRVAEIAGEYLKKGRAVYIEGSLRTEKWQDKNGADRYTTKIIGRDMKMLGGRDDASATEQLDSATAGNGGENQGIAALGDGSKTAGNPAADDGFDDDIPF